MASVKAGLALRSVFLSKHALYSCGSKTLSAKVTPVISISQSFYSTQPKGDIDKAVDSNLTKIRQGDFTEHGSHPEQLTHFKTGKKVGMETADFDDWTQAAKEWKDKTKRPGEQIVGARKDEPLVGADSLPHPIWSESELHKVEITHKEPKGFVDRLALFSVKTVRGGFDILSGFNKEPRTEKTWISRIIFLETVAGVPGMVAAMVRHLHSLRRMRRDHGWIHTLLEEAENERMHLMTALHLRNPTFLFRYAVLGTQGIFVTFFSLAYLISPRYCHRFVGYLEEEAVVTYSKLLKDMDGGSMKHWNTLAAPPIAISYWKLKPEATMYDVVLAIRADEAHHRLVNHTLGSMKPDDYNPYKPGE